MLPKAYRLRLDKDFARIAKYGQPFYARELGVKILKNNLTVSRFGFIVSTKISKKAVVRNKIKRRLRAIIYTWRKDISVGYDIMILCRPEVKNLDFWQLKDMIYNLLNRAKLFIKVNN